MEKKLTIGALCIAFGLIGFALISSKNDSIEHLQITKEIKTNMLATVSAQDFASKNTKEERIIIDVRTPGEYEEGHLKGAENIDVSSPTFLDDLNALDKNAQYSIYCRSGNRSSQVLQIMKASGFKDVLDLQGGIVAWDRAGETLCMEC